jgi:hypothetical protein
MSDVPGRWRNFGGASGEEKASSSMGAGKLRVIAGCGIFAIGVTALAGAYGHASSSSSLAAGQVPGLARPTVSPSAVPVLGKLFSGAFPATPDGTRALTICEQWSGLRGEYVPHVQADTPYQLEQWFSSAVWRPAFTANGPLRIDPAYGDISTAFGLATTAEAASIPNARFLDKACAAVD